LKKAFSIAPPFFQTQLCELTSVYINPTSCTSSSNNYQNNCTANSWGFRDPSTGATYVALSQSLWNQPNADAMSYSAYETYMLQYLIGWPKSTTLYYSPATPYNTYEVTILAALAHEVGHVLLYDAFKPQPGVGTIYNPYNTRGFGAGVFYSGSWRKVDMPPQFREFGEPQNEHDPAGCNGCNDHVAKIAFHVLHQNFDRAVSILANIYASTGRWASLFGAMSPDEDFVEMFKFYVLTQSSTEAVASLQLNYLNATGKLVTVGDIYNDYSSNSKNNSAWLQKIGGISGTKALVPGS
jgi:hypothetical protein